MASRPSENHNQHPRTPLGGARGEFAIQSTTTASVAAPRVSVVRPDDISAELVARWEQLEAESLTGNPFASPAYVLPAMKHLKSARRPLLLTIEHQEALIGLCVVEAVTASRRLPLPHLRSWRTDHGFLDCPLLHRSAGADAAHALWQFLKERKQGWHGIEFARFPLDTAVAEVMTKTQQDVGIGSWDGTSWERAALITDAEVSDRFMRNVSLRRARSLRKGWRALERLGPVEYHLHRSGPSATASAESLMRLESLGWKSCAGTALSSTADGQQFFREMTNRFAESHRCAFGELTVGDQTVASVVHLLSGKHAFAFKLGWNPDFERGCPGFQLKAQAALQATDALPGIELIDSCANPGSFIERVWPDRRTLCTRIYLTSRLAVASTRVLDGFRRLRSLADSMRREIKEDHDESVNSELTSVV